MSQKKDSTKLQNFSIEADSFLSSDTRRAIVTIKAGINCFKSGVVTKKQLRRHAGIMKKLLNADTKTLNREIRDLIAAL